MLYTPACGLLATVLVSVNVTMGVTAFKVLPHATAVNICMMTTSIVS